MTINQPQKIIVHHSTGRDHDALDWETIRRCHMEERGWNDVGYHYGVELVSGVYRVQYGRATHVVGAHAKGKNLGALGLCLVGDFELGPVPAGQMALAKKLIKGLMLTFGIGPEAVLGHREIMAPGYTQCPGRFFDMDALRDELRREE